MTSATPSFPVDQVLDKRRYHQCWHFDWVVVLPSPFYNRNRATVQFILVLQSSLSPSPYVLLNFTLNESSFFFFFFFFLFRSIFSWRSKGILRFQAIALLLAGERITVLMPYHVSPTARLRFTARLTLDHHRLPLPCTSSPLRRFFALCTRSRARHS